MFCLHLAFSVCNLFHETEPFKRYKRLLVQHLDIVCGSTLRTILYANNKLNDNFSNVHQHYLQNSYWMNGYQMVNQIRNGTDPIAHEYEYNILLIWQMAKRAFEFK